MRLNFIWCLGMAAVLSVGILGCHQKTDAATIAVQQTQEESGRPEADAGKAQEETRKPDVDKEETSEETGQTDEEETLEETGLTDEGKVSAEAGQTQGETRQKEAGQTSTETVQTQQPEKGILPVEEVSLSPEMKYAEFSEISSGTAKLYRSDSKERKNITVCVNAGHGTKGGESVKTRCHPDGTPKVTGGTTGKGAVSAVAVSSGMTFLDGTPEREITLKEALLLRDKLLDHGYDVLMIRETDDVQLDNVARTVLANHYADCHIAIHWDSSESDKGAFYMSVPSDKTYRSMEPVASTWQKSNRFGECLIKGLKDQGRKIYGEGSMEMDLTQTSYSSVASVDVELGDKKSEVSDEALAELAEGLLKGVDYYFEQIQE